MLLLDIGIISIIESIKKTNTELPILNLSSRKTRLIIDKFNTIIFKNSRIPKHIQVLIHSIHTYNRSLHENTPESTMIEYGVLVSQYLYMTTIRPQKVLPTNAMQLLVEHYKHTIATPILRHFLESMGTIPLGTYIQVDNDITGMVIRHHQDNPLTLYLKPIDYKQPKVAIETHEDAQLKILSPIQIQQRTQ